MSWETKRSKEINILFDKICKKFSVKKDELISKSRKKPLVISRKYFMNILFEVFEKEDSMNHADISKVINRDRTSFIYNRKEHLNEHARYKSYKEDYDTFKKEFVAEL